MAVWRAGREVQEAMEDARVEAHLCALLGDTWSSSRSMSCGMRMSQSGPGDEGKQYGGTGSRQDSQKGVQEARQAGLGAVPTRVEAHVGARLGDT